MPRATAMAAYHGAGLDQARPQALPGHFEQAEMADPTHLDTGSVVLQRLLQPALDLAIVALILHVDEVDDDQACEVAQAELSGDLVRRLEVGLKGGFLDMALARGTA